MKKKVLSILFALVLVLSFSLMTAVPAGAVDGTDWYVDGAGTDDGSHGMGTGADAFKTIQYAIDDTRVATGDTINVAAGTYSEAGEIGWEAHYGLKIDSTKSGITLSGANAGIPGTGTRVPESIIVAPLVLHGNAIFIFKGADGVTVDGFTLRAYDDVVENRANNVVIKNNIIESLPCLSLGDVTFINGSTAVTGSGFNTDLAAEWKIKLDADGVWVQVASIQSDTSLTLTAPYTGTGGTGLGSKVPDSNIPGIFACDCTNLKVLDNLIQNTSGIGIFLGVTAEGIEYHVTNSFIEGNLIDNTGYTGILAYATDGILIKNNIIRDAGPDPSECSAGVRENDGIRAGAYGSGLTIEYNDIYGCCYCGVQIKANATSHHINWNNIYGNGHYGVLNVAGDSVDATKNWWGAPNGPDDDAEVINGFGNRISLDVNADPWAVDESCTRFASTGGIVGLRTEGPPAVIGISVSPTFINFGTVSAATVAIGPELRVTNTGNGAISVSAELTEDTAYNEGNFYADALYLSNILGGGAWTAGDLGLESIAADAIGTVPTKLVGPAGITVGATYTGIVVFWAEPL